MSARPVREITAPELLEVLRRIETRAPLDSAPGAWPPSRSCALANCGRLSGDHLEAAEWRIPAERMKMRAIHIVPLSVQAVVCLRELHPLTGTGHYVFPGLRTPTRPMSENTVNAALRRLGYAKDDMTGHGLRSMASTLLNEQGWHRDAIERQLAHGERDVVRAAYNYAEHLPERRRMMQAWADYLDGLKNGAEVMPLRFAGPG